MRVQDIMTNSVRTVPQTTEAAAAWELMKKDGIHHLVVIRGSDVLGVLSAHDMGGRTGARVRKGRTVADLMTRHILTVKEEDTVGRVSHLMQGRSIGCLPVLRRGRLIGIVTTSDLLQRLGDGVDRPGERARRTLNYKVAHRKQRRAGGAW
jgi:acetoin utilization protein AcuB